MRNTKLVRTMQLALLGASTLAGLIVASEAGAQDISVSGAAATAPVAGKSPAKNLQTVTVTAEK